MITRNILDSYIDRTMTEICLNGYDPENNCAHFVSHVLKLSFGATCAAQTSGHRHAGAAANIRVKEIFERCLVKRELLSCPTKGIGLIFVSGQSNFRGSPVEIADVKKKHVGILYNGQVWHYSNLKKWVIRQTVGEFFYHYKNQTNSLWFGSFPAASRPTYFGTCSIAV